MPPNRKFLNPRVLVAEVAMVADNFANNWQLEAGGLSLNSRLTISFQRYPLPRDGVLISPSPSFGALPIANSSAGLLLPLSAGEAFWIGFFNCDESRPVAVGVAVETSTGEVLDTASGTAWRDRATSSIVAPQRELDGILRLAGGWWPLTRINPHPAAPQCRALKVVATEVQRSAELNTISIALLDPADFFDLTGWQSLPLDPSAVYGGWLLP